MIQRDRNASRPQRLARHHDRLACIHVLQFVAFAVFRKRQFRDERVRPAVLHAEDQQDAFAFSGASYANDVHP